MTNVSDIIDEAPIGRLQIIVFSSCIFVSWLDGFNTQAIAFVAPAIMRQWAVSRLDFGFVFSGTLLGSAIGSVLFGALADRIGRKWLVVSTTLLFAIFGLACATATNFEQLLIYRVLGGLGLGGVIPNMIALTSEYAPKRARTTIISFTLWGFPFGAIIGGLASRPLIAQFGWRSVMIAGGATALVAVPVLILCLPESLRFLALKTGQDSAVARIVARIAPQRVSELAPCGAAAPGTMPEAPGGIASLFGPGLASITVLVSAALALSLFVVYLLINWIPAVLAAAGMSVSHAILGTVAINFGGIAGSYVISRAIDRRIRPLWLLAASYLVACVAILIVGNVSGSVVGVVAALTTCGFFLIGAQLSVSAFAAGQYPVAMRGTGIGFVQAVGRLGSLIGPLVGGVLLSWGVSGPRLFMLTAVPAFIAAILLLALAVLKDPPGRPAPLPRQNA